MRNHTASGFARGIVWRLAIVMTIAYPLAAAEPAPAPPEPSVPPFLRGVDLSAPAQDAFREWPPPALLERPYWLPFQWPAFQRAVLFDRPVLLVMTVGWSRTAQRFDEEVLSDPEVLRALNDGFLTVRVDADRRPELRSRFAVGTWPTLSLLLPSGLPMLSQANKSKKALPIASGALDKKSLLFVLSEGKTYYERWPDLLRGVAERWLQEDIDGPFTKGPVAPASSDRVRDWLAGNADYAGGGFGLAPKSVVAGLSEYASILAGRGKGELAEHARTTLDKLVAGPLFDAREGGVHRLAAAPEWGSIQYEKMLAGNVDLIRDLTFSLRQGSSAPLRAALARTCGFLGTVLARPGGGYFSAQVADPGSPDGSGWWTAKDRPSGPGVRAPPVLPLVLSGENARAGAALLRAAALLDDDALDRAGRAAIALVLGRSFHPGRGVDHVVEPAPDTRRFLESQADVAFALLDAYESTGDRAELQAAKDVADFALANLASPGDDGLRDHLLETPTVGMLIAARRPMNPNARMARALTRLAAHGLGDSYRDRAIAIVGKYAGDLASFGPAGIEGALAVEEIAAEPLRIEIEGSRDAGRTRALRRAAMLIPHAWTLVTTAAGAEELKPAAIVRWHGSTVRVERPDQLAGEVSRLIDPKPSRTGK